MARTVLPTPGSELKAYKMLADEYLALDKKGLAAAEAAGAIVEVICDDQEIQK